MKEPRETIVAGILLLLVTAAVSGGLQAWQSGVELRDILSVSPVESAAFEAGIPLLRTPEVRQIHADGTALFLDARAMQEYDQGHLPGAFSLPFHDFETAFPGVAPILSPTDPLIVYCSGPGCDDALQVALRLRDAGFATVQVYLDGWEGWTQ